MKSLRSCLFGVVVGGGGESSAGGVVDWGKCVLSWLLV